jgi:hypothetical protein
MISIISKLKAKNVIIMNLTGKKISEIIIAFGHKKILSTHKTTFEITKDLELTERGDCIIAVGSMKGAADLSPNFKKAAKRDGAQITVLIDSGGVREVVRAEGSQQLLFSHSKDLVVRRSDYICNRTIAIRADKAAKDISRTLVRKMMNPQQEIKITLSVESH